MKLGAMLALGAVSLSMANQAIAQQLEREPSPPGEAMPQPYLGGHEVDYRGVLGPPPPAHSYQDIADSRAVEDLQSVEPARWSSAELDAARLYPRFEDALGRPIDRKTSPMLIKLLNRTLREVSATTFAAKEHFHRPRPYQLLSLQRVCGVQIAPKPEIHPTGGSSYPSGHSAYGWAAAMILARVAPERADGLMARAQEYAESRIICGVHFPSDIQAGQVLAAAVVDRLDAAAGFQADLALARAEHLANARP